MKKKMQLEVVIDIVCPFCFIGKENLYRAMEQLGEQFDFELKFLPFQLDPSIPLSGIDREEYMKNKFGDSPRFAEVQKNLQSMSSNSGIQLNFESIKKTINTFKCHRLISYARHFDLQKEVVDSLFYHYFTEGLDLSNDGYLLRIGEEAGLKTEDLMNYLDSDEGTEEVNELMGQAHAMGVSGVPFVVINRALAVSGAQSSESFVAAILEADRM